MEDKAAALLVFTGVIAPAVGFGLECFVARWGPELGGCFATLRDSGGRRSGSPQSLDPAMQAAEVRQMLIAKAERQRRRGESAVDVEAEAERLLGTPPPSARERLDAELRSEVRHFIVSRNHRRVRQGLEPLDIAAETERQLTDLDVRQ